MLYSFSQEDLRSICRNSIESFEIWARRIIHEKLIAAYGSNYLETIIDNNEKVLNTEHYSKYLKVKQNNPDRCQRPVDALFIDTLVYILCKEKFYKQFFKGILDFSYPQGRDETLEFLNRIITPRNSLSHANPISVRQAEQIVCYTNGFIDAAKKYFITIGEERMWNTPCFIKVIDSFGNEFYPNDKNTLSDYFQIEDHIFYVGDTYKIWVEVDNSFDESGYKIKWSYTSGINNVVSPNNTKEFSITFTELQIGAHQSIVCDLIQNKTWHKHSNYDHCLRFVLQVLPPHM